MKSGTQIAAYQSSRRRMAELFSQAGAPTPNFCMAVLKIGRRFHIALAAVFALSLFGVAQTAPATSSVRILAPKPGEVLNNNFVLVKYEVVQPASAAGSPTFQVQLDARDPILTTDQQQNFTGLQPGRHTILVQIVDANNTPVAGSRAEVQFTVAQPRTGLLVPEAQAQDIASNSRPSSSLPRGGSALPILSAIGLGSLLGGIFSVFRTRR
jgi:hypothetical protein